MNIVVQENGRYVNSDATFLDSQCIDDDADQNVNHDTLTDSDEDGGDLVSGNAPSSHYTKVYELPARFDESWRGCTTSSRFSADGEFKFGQEFDYKKQLINMIRVYSVKRNQFFSVLESDKHKFVAECKRKKECGCTWRIRATKKHARRDMFKVVRYAGPHIPTCLGNVDNNDHAGITSQFIAREITDLLRTDPSLKVRTISELMKEKYGYVPSYKRSCLAKQKAISEIFGDWEASYSDLPHFMLALQHSNPGTVVHWYSFRYR
ncbi:unnamed protein product [Cuscuta europaea]|uniref:Transposase MuDR plant domain-containing protein n=1 Tax=Cuscuta europaea TaxID=41803 RepID=A0A9P1EBU3_CUSEU|nr:unnamed protein product [Cuscuta europaea]